MKAIVFDKSNAPDHLVLRDVEKPVLGEGEVLIKIHAVSINAADYRSMKMGIIPKCRIFGSDVAGQIEAVGKHTTKYKVGDTVFGDLSACGFGGFAEYVTAPEDVLAILPSGITYETAAALPMAAVTALQGLRDKGQIQPGQKVLICGGGGGVGSFAVQLAKYYGTDVTAVCGRHNVETVRSLGADRVIDYTQNDFAKGSDRYDLILAIGGNRSLFAYRRVLSHKGICIMIGGAVSQAIRFLLFGRFLSLGGKKMRSLAAKPNARDLDFVIQLVAEGKMSPVIDRRYPLSEIPEAVRYLSKGHAKGKVVISV